MKLVRQPPGSRQCGQACIAMLANIPLEDVTGMIGGTLTTWLELYSALFEFGITCMPHTQPAYGPDDLPELAILLCPAGGAMRHAVVHHQGNILDPAVGTYHALELPWEGYGRQHVKFAAVTNLPA